MKIAFIPSTFLPIIGGAEIQTHNLANLLSKKGVIIDIWNTKKASYKKKNYNLCFFNKLILNTTYVLRYYFKIKISFFFKKLFKKNNTIQEIRYLALPFG